MAPLDPSAASISFARVERTLLSAAAAVGVGVAFAFRVGVFEWPPLTLRRPPFPLPVWSGHSCPLPLVLVLLLLLALGCLNGPLGPSAASISWEKIKTNFKLKGGGQECPPRTVI